MKKILYFIAVICFIFISCNKDEDNSQSNIKPVNKYRVKRLYGTDEKLGDVQYLFNYNEKNELNSAWICDTNSDIEKRDTCGSGFSYISRMAVGTGATVADFIVYEKFHAVLKIDADSVQRIKDLYPDTYTDTLKKRRANAIVKGNFAEKAKLIKKDLEYIYVPRIENGEGKDYEYTYLKSLVTNNRYEYNDNGVVVVTRQMVDSYVLDDRNTAYTTTTYKTEYQYSGDKILSAKKYTTRNETAEDNSSWEEINSYTYTYDGNILTGISAKDFTLNRSGNIVTVTENDLSTIYELDEEDYVIKITYPDGNYFNVEYEDGAGNYEHSVPLYRKLLGIPYIK